jgi:hypothetical protein
MDIALALATALALQGPASIQAKPAPPTYPTPNYALTFHKPPGSSYCPLPADWVGSDHGTILFLSLPALCGGAGFPSSSRGFSPPNLPRIEIFYSYSDEDGQTKPSCNVVGKANLLSRQRPLCKDTSDGMTTITMSANYKADNPAQLIITLVSAPDRLDSDLRSLVVLANSVRTCSSHWSSADGKRAFVAGSGPPCPANAKWF